MQLNDWLNQMALYYSASSIIHDDQKIVYALTCLCALASTYMKVYFDKVQSGANLGSWSDFTQELKNIYGQRDDKEGAKKKLTALWVNRDLAKKNFVKYVERYQILTRIVNYTDEVHIDKLKEVVPDKLQNTLVIYEITNQTPKNWDDYIKLLISAYKALYPDKTQGTIFGSDGNIEKSGEGKRDLDVMEIDEVKKKEGKSLWYCQICTGKGFKSKAKSYNIVDCYDKPRNEDKQKSSFQSTFTLGSRNKNQSFKVWLIKLLEEESDNSDPLSEDVNINSTSIKETSDLSLLKRKRKENPNLDFPLGL